MKRYRKRTADEILKRKLEEKSAVLIEERYPFQKNVFIRVLFFRKNVF